MRCIEVVVLAVVGATLASTARARDDDLLEDIQMLDGPRPAWVLTAGAEFDGEGGDLFGGSAGFSPREHTTLTLNTVHSDTSTVNDKLTATAVGLDFDQDFEHWGFGLSVAYWKDPDLVEAADYGGSVFLKWGGWQLLASALARASDFNSFTVSGAIPRPNLPPLTVSGQASCDLDDRGIGARLAFTGQRWSGYLSGKNYDYDQFNCGFSSVTVGAVKISPDRLRTLSPAFLGRLTVRATAAGSINVRENTLFLDSSIAAGISTMRGTRMYAIDYLHTKERFDGLAANTLSASLTFATSRRTDLEIHLGIFDAEQANAIGFAGVTLIAYLGG